MLVYAGENSEDITDNASERVQDVPQRCNMLLNNPGFWLVHVPNDSNQLMTMVRPADDPEIREEIDFLPGQLKFYALSHMWGSTASEHMWDVGSSIIQQNGQPVDPVPMRPEKRETLLALLRAHPGSYWWIDVLCARVDTPLVIMSDIYAFCDKCYAMLDKCQGQYFGVLADRQNMDQMWKDMRRQIAKCSKGERNAMATLEELFQERHTEWQLMVKLTKGRWWDRVWTLQELLLPGERLWLLPETGGVQSIEYPVPCVKILKLMICINQFEEMGTKWEFERICHARTSGRFRRICYDLTNGHVLTFASSSDRSWRFDDSITRLVELLSKSERTCMDPLDYVYGVLGLFGYNIPRMADPGAVWSRFIDELDKDIKLVMDVDDEEAELWGFEYDKLSTNENTEHIDLATARSFADVYGGWLIVTRKDGSTFTV